MYNVKQDRTQLRQTVIDQWFAKFVDNELYDRADYYEFCIRMKVRSELEIERIFKLEKRQG